MKGSREESGVNFRSWIDDVVVNVDVIVNIFVF